MSLLEESNLSTNSAYFLSLMSFYGSTNIEKYLERKNVPYLFDDAKCFVIVKISFVNYKKIKLKKKLSYIEHLFNILGNNEVKQLFIFLVHFSY